MKLLLGTRIDKREYIKSLPITTFPSSYYTKTTINSNEIPSKNLNLSLIYLSITYKTRHCTKNAKDKQKNLSYSSAFPSIAETIGKP